MDKSAGIYIFLMGIFLGEALCVCILGLTGVIAPYPNLIISNSTATDICHNLTNDMSVRPSAKDGKLICTIPTFTFDHTENIMIIKGDGMQHG